MFESLKNYFSGFTHNSEPLEKPATQQAEVSPENENNAYMLSAFENAIKDKLSQAKDWTSQIYTSLKSNENAASPVQNQLRHVDVNSVINKVPLLREFQKTQAEFLAEQRQKHPELNEPNAASDASCLPWHPDACGLTDPDAVANLRSRILALSQSPNTFLLPPPAEAQLGSTSLSTEQWLLAKLLLQEDPKLAEMRYNLVPSKINEDLFWRNYFYRMALLRQSAHLAAVTGAETQLELGAESPGNFVYIEENYDNAPNEADQPLEAAPPKNESKTPKRRGKGKKLSSEPVKTTPSEATTEVRENPEEKEKRNVVQSVDELLDAEIAREVDELVLVSSDEPLNDELDRELELELAELEKKN